MTNIQPTLPTASSSLASQQSTKTKEEKNEEFLKFVREQKQLVIAMMQPNPSDFFSSEPSDPGKHADSLFKIMMIEKKLEQAGDKENTTELLNKILQAQTPLWDKTKIALQSDVLNLPKEGSVGAGYELSENMRLVDIVVRNQNGELVYKAQGNADAGKQHFEWDGNNSNQERAAEGKYKIEVIAHDINNKSHLIETETYALPQGTRIDDKGNVFLKTGESEIAFPPKRSAKI
jgi:flagellar hook assembly protein FlgD